MNNKIDDILDKKRAREAMKGLPMDMMMLTTSGIDAPSVTLSWVFWMRYTNKFADIRTRNRTVSGGQWLARSGHYTCPYCKGWGKVTVGGQRL